MASEETAFLAKLRAKVISLACGVVVEVGAGTGRNFFYYDAANIKQLYAVEPDPFMRRRALPRRPATVPVAFVEAAAEQLPFPTGYADTIVSTLVLCSVDRPQVAAQELYRVLKPGGQLLFIEHIRSADPWRARLENLVALVWPLVAGGCHPDRATMVTLGNAGFEVRELARETCHAPFGQPMVAGVGVRST